MSYHIRVEKGFQSLTTFRCLYMGNFGCSWHCVVTKDAKRENFVDLREKRYENSLYFERKNLPLVRKMCLAGEANGSGAKGYQREGKEKEDEVTRKSRSNQQRAARKMVQVQRQRKWTQDSVELRAEKTEKFHTFW